MSLSGPIGVWKCSKKHFHFHISHLQSLYWTNVYYLVFCNSRGLGLTQLVSSRPVFSVLLIYCFGIYFCYPLSDWKINPPSSNIKQYLIVEGWEVITRGLCFLGELNGRNSWVHNASICIMGGSRPQKKAQLGTSCIYSICLNSQFTFDVWNKPDQNPGQNSNADYPTYMKGALGYGLNTGSQDIFISHKRHCHPRHCHNYCRNGHNPCSLSIPTRSSSDKDLTLYATNSNGSSNS